MKIYNEPIEIIVNEFDHSIDEVNEKVISFPRSYKARKIISGGSSSDLQEICIIIRGYGTTEQAAKDNLFEAMAQLKKTVEEL